MNMNIIIKLAAELQIFILDKISQFTRLNKNDVADMDYLKIISRKILVKKNSLCTYKNINQKIFAFFLETTIIKAHVTKENFMVNGIC